MAEHLKKLHGRGISFHGVTAADDTLALAALKYARKMGYQVPEDTTLMGVLAG